MIETMNTVEIPVERVLPDEAILPNSERYVPPLDRIVIRGQLCQWSKVDPKGYKDYSKLHNALDKLERDFAQNERTIRHKMQNCVEFTRRKYPGN